MAQKIAVHQFNREVTRRDGIGNTTFVLQKLLHGLGYSSEVFVERSGAGLEGAVRQVEELRANPDDILLIHHALANDLDRIANFKCRKVLVYHSITPPKLFRRDDPQFLETARGYEQILKLADLVEASIAVSGYNAAQLRQRGLRNVTVIPFHKDFLAIRDASFRHVNYFGGMPGFRLLFVGRITEHKRQLELIESVGTLRTVGGKPLQLVLVGHAEHGQEYKALIDRRILELKLTNRVALPGSIDDAELYGQYRTADAFVSFSEHEGFGVPLIEAMTLDLPVIAYDAGAVSDTIGQGGILIGDKSLSTLAMHIGRLQEDPDFRANIVRKQRERVEWYGRSRIENALDRWLKHMCGAASTSAASDAADFESRSPSNSRASQSAPPLSALHGEPAAPKSKQKVDSLAAARNWLELLSAKEPEQLASDVEWIGPIYEQFPELEILHPRTALVKSLQKATKEFSDEHAHRILIFCCAINLFNLVEPTGASYIEETATEVSSDFVGRLVRNLPGIGGLTWAQFVLVSDDLIKQANLESMRQMLSNMLDQMNSKSMRNSARSELVQSSSPSTPSELLPMMSIGTAGERDGAAVRARPWKAGHVIFGPYLTLSKGHYLARVRFELLWPAPSFINRRPVAIEVIDRDVVLARRSINPNGAGSQDYDLPFVVDDSKQDQSTKIEVRVSTSGKSPLLISSVVIESASSDDQRVDRSRVEPKELDLLRGGVRDPTRLNELFQSHELLRSVVSKWPPLDVYVRGSRARGPVLFNAIPLEISKDATSACEQIGRMREGQPCIVLGNALQFIDDYRSVIAACFAKIAKDGWLIVIVPHQFLFERRLQLPSRFRAVSRFYTPASLLCEIEEALDPNEYRVRSAFDFDKDYAYDTALTDMPAGGSSIVVALQRIEKPRWSGELEKELKTLATTPTPAHIGPPGLPEESPYHVVASDQTDIRRIVVIKLDHRGDFILATPAYKLLREYYHRAEITLVCGSWNLSAARGSGLFDEVIPFDFWHEDMSTGKPLPPEQQRVAAFAELMEGRSFDLAIDLRLYDDTRQLCEVIDARHKAGFDRRLSFPWLDVSLSTPYSTKEGRAEKQVSLAAREFRPIWWRRRFRLLARNLWRGDLGGRCIVWGPYRELAPGSYEIEVLIEPLAGAHEVEFDVCSHGATETHASGTLKLKKGIHPTFQFSLDDPIKDFEFRLMAPKDGKIPLFKFKGLRYRRRGEIFGQHQSEAMCLLVHLTAMRLRNGSGLEVVNV